MFRFEHIEILWALILIPVFTILHIIWIKWRKNAFNKLGDWAIIKKLVSEYSSALPNFKLILFLIAYSLLIIGAANPQIGSKMEEVKREGVEIMIALDLSNSMLAEDIAPNRLEKSKRAISQLIDKLKNDKIGIIVFGGQAYVQLPITTDYAAAKLFLATINTGIIPTQGTAIGAAIDLAVSSFDKKSATSKTIIVITDGENHEDNATDAATAAAEAGIVVHTIGMGSAQGAPIPIYRGQKQIGFRKDKEGNSVVTKLNEEMLQEIASAGNGAYVRANNANAGLDYLLKEINKMEKSELGSKVYTDYEDRFQYFIGAALLFFLLDFMISNKKIKWMSNFKLFDVNKEKN